MTALFFTQSAQAQVLKGKQPHYRDGERAGSRRSRSCAGEHGAGVGLVRWAAPTRPFQDGAASRELTWWIAEHSSVP